MSNYQDLAEQLQLIKEELNEATRKNQIPELVESKARTLILEVIEETKTSSPNKSSILDYLNKASACIDGISSVSSIFSALREAYNWVETSL
ncbi:hypothetical protein ACO0LF_28720 [Undibacterium sp. Di27W]|uniref:hypothetical protein n=1 Tax=Undibacterium sp. Di27W TaxID=3413036 RepID=UPI003BF15108